jgi:glycosyltransferase involved in cell wall biosynthesis
MAKVTVVTIVRNGGLFISEAIESILAQSFKDFEYLVLDDASTDNTLDIVEEFAKRDARLKIIANSVQLGIPLNRNQGILLATGEFIAWQDSDDISVPHRLERQVAFLNSNPDVGMVGGYLHFFGNGRESIRTYAEADDAIRRTVFRYAAVSQPTAMIRSSALEEVGGFDPDCTLAEDIELTLRIGNVFKFANLPEVLLHYREHPESSTFQSLRTMERATLRIRWQYSSRGYRMTAIDRLYCTLQYLTIYLLPPRLRIWLFKRIRNRPLIGQGFDSNH